MEIKNEWLWKTVCELKDFPHGGKILHPKSVGAVAILPHRTRILLSVENAVVGATRQAIKHILDKNSGEFLVRKTPEIIMSHEAVYESKLLDEETGRPRILLVKSYPDGKDLFSVVEIKLAGAENRLVTTARVGKNYLRSLKKIR
jgi:hypothetical protein